MEPLPCGKLKSRPLSLHPANNFTGINCAAPNAISSYGGHQMVVSFFMVCREGQEKQWWAPLTLFLSPAYDCAALRHLLVPEKQFGEDPPTQPLEVIYLFIFIKPRFKYSLERAVNPSSSSF